MFRPRLAGLFAALLTLLPAFRFAPYPALREFQARGHSTRFYDRSGVLLHVSAVEDGKRREYAPLAAIPPALRDLVVFSEDRRFFCHEGVDAPALFRALFQNTRRGRTVSGASTITMQLARLTGGPQRRSLGGKAREALNAARLELRLSKNEILERYLNALPFGMGCEGLASGARTIFSRDLSRLSSAQMLLLAVIPRRPALYNPALHPQESAAAAAALARRVAGNRRLSARYPELASVTAGELLSAASQARRFTYPFEMPHYVRYVNGLLSQTEGARPGALRLAADIRLQRRAEGLLSGAAERYRASRLGSGAALVIDNRSGEILCWAGSASFYDAESAGQVDGVLALNQPGSSLKPFLYALALESGFLPSDVLADIPRQYGEPELYVPQNFNNRFNGPVRLRVALASSLNIPAVELLFRLGVRRYGQKLQEAGLASLSLSLEDAGLGLALGNAPVSLLELVRAFSVFPNDGLLPALRVTARSGAEGPAESTAKDEDEDEDEDEARFFASAPFACGAGRRVFDADTARIISSMLSGKNARALAFGVHTNFDTPFPSMFKTGTANQYQSIVALAATPLYTVGVWMGNVTGETVIGRTGSSVPAAIARDLLMYAQGNRAPAFAPPEGWELAPVCALSGLAPGPGCPSLAREWLRRGGGGAACSWHGPRGLTYPAEYQAWFFTTPRKGALDYGSAPLEVQTPRDGFIFYAGGGAGRMEIPAEVTGGKEDQLFVQYDAEEWAVERPFMFFLPQERGPHRLTVRCGDEEQTVTFHVD